MWTRTILALVAAALAWAAPPTPREHFGWTPGDDYKLADYSEVVAYFQRLAKASDRIRLVEYGRSSHGKPMYLAFLSSPDNLKNLERYKQISRRLALGEASPEEARRLAAEGKAIVWIDSGLHASEVATVQHAPDLAWRMVSGEDEETRRIRDKVILLQAFCVNPDGLDWVVHWYRKNVGTPYELAPLPHLYQKYAGHDNNRDWFMMNLEETRHIARLFYHEWFPQIIYNQHQAPAFPARIFVPPNAEPLNPNVPPSVMEGVSMIGAAMRERFARENKPGVLSYLGYDSWWNGGMRTTPYYHNMHGILTETAASGYATPRTYRAEDFPERFSSGIPTKLPTMFYAKPWLGGRWTLRDAIDYMLTADFAILDLASSRSEHFLWKAHESARTAIELGRKGRPFGYVVPASQPDRTSAMEFLRRLHLGGVKVERAQLAFRAGGREYPEGTYVLPAAQAFRAYLVDLVEPQKYPELRTGTGGPTKRPYDIAGWTLSMQMGVTVDRVDDPFDARVEPATAFAAPADPLDRRDNGVFHTAALALAENTRVRRDAMGDLLVDGRAEAARFDKAAWELRAPRVALYEPWTANMDTGWTQFVLDHFQIPHTTLRNADVRQGKLRARFDAIILASQTAASILHGTRAGEPAGRGRAGDVVALQRPEYTGGIGIEGLREIESFVRAGGTLIAFDAATELPVQFFPLPVRALLRSTGDTPGGADPPAAGYYCPGSLLRINVDDAHPIGLGMPKQAIAFSSGGQAWDITLVKDENRGEREVRSVARYADSNLLASGWVSGEREVLGKHILLEARHGAGRVVLFGFRPQFRGQPHGTFKLLLNSIYLSAAKPL
jgi:hypothetical protein